MHVDLKVPSINMILYETEIDILKKFLLTQKIEDSFSNGIFIKRKAEYLIRISSNAEKYKYWEET